MNKLYYFNPGHEMAFLSKAKQSFEPSKLLRQMQRDLAALPAWLSADAADVVLCSAEMPTWLPAMPLQPYPRLINISDASPCSYSLQLELWGQERQWRDYVLWQLRAMDLQVQAAPISIQHRELSHRRQSAHCLAFLVSEMGYPQQLIPHWYESVAVFRRELSSVFEGSDQLLLKVPFSSSGRGLFWIDRPIDEEQWTRIECFTAQHSSFSVEPKFRIAQDFAMEFLVSSEGAEFEAYSLFKTAAKGAYEGNKMLAQNLIEAELSRQIPLAELRHLQTLLAKYLTERYAPYYTGPIGVDMAVYIDLNGEIKLHPCIEINPRYTMGLLAARLFEHYVDPSAHGRFHVASFKAKAAALDFATRSFETHPAQIRQGRLQKGFMTLSPVDSENRFLAYLLLD